ncbi:MAG: ABC transporter ATP-binding protein/permease [Clostridiales bacterium]|nr:ABC transporter ATP-binding protein/permease [Clostridiales bacterium]
MASSPKPIKMGQRGKGPRPKIEHPFKILGRIFGYTMKWYWIHYIFVIICVFASTFSSVQGTLFMKTLIDEYIIPLIGQSEPDFIPLLWAIGRVAAFYLIGVIAAFVQARLLMYITQGTLRNLRNELFNKMESLPVKYFDTHSHGDIMSVYTNDIDTLRQMISQSIPQFLSSIVTIISVLASMFVLSWALTLITLSMVGVMLFCTAKLSAASGKNFAIQQKSLGSVNGYIEEIMTGQKVVKSFCYEEKAMEEFRKRNDELFVSADKANTFANILMPINAQLGNLSYVICAIVGGAFAIKGIGSFTIGALASFLTFNKQFAHPINQISMQLNSIMVGLAGGQRIFDLLDQIPETDEGYVTLVNAKMVDGKIEECKERTGIWAWKHFHKADGTTTYVELKGDVEFHNVDFAYEEGHPVLFDIDLFATPGQKIAFVGSTGAGKTTITNLINRFYDIADGKIRYDGININKIKKNDLRHSLGVVLQETHLFSMSVKDNIRYGKLDATDEEVYAAAKLANADSFIRHLPHGYDTILEGDGANLSQGQRQLLAIARAAIADPPVLILDEATSSIDTHTESLVQKGMDKLMKGRTTFVIAHRLSTVKNSDCIIVLEKGRIIERGNHDQLIEKKGRYYHLYTGNKAQS